MANERMYLYCRNCGARLYLGKHSIAAFHFSPEYGKRLANELEKFYSDHAFCYADYVFWESGDVEKVDERYATDYPHVSDFGIVYESSDIYTRLPGGDNL